MPQNLKTEPDNLSRGPTSPPQIGEFEITEIERYEQAGAPWELLVRPIGTAAFGWRAHYLLTPSFVLYRESFASRLHVQGLTPVGLIGFSVPVRLGGQSSYWGQTLHQHGLPASVGGALDAVIDAGQSHLIVLLTPELVQRHLAPAEAALLQAVAKTRVLPAAKEKVDDLRRWLLDALAHAHRWPSVVNHPAALAVLEQELLARVLAAVTLPTASAQRPSLSRRRVALDRAVAYLREADVTALTIPDLCTAARVSQRTLEHAFRETYGLGPLAFLRRWRLHRVRRELLFAPTAGVTVSDVARGLGFWHLGRFATEYQRLFDERPSETLRRAKQQSNAWTTGCG